MKYIFILILLISSCTTRIILGSKCDFIIPNEYELCYSKSMDKYSIRIKSNNEFLKYSIRYDDVYTIPQDISKPELFSDSCVAKAFLYKYIHQYGEKDFQPIK